jgi:hypothetical protein
MDHFVIQNINQKFIFNNKCEESQLIEVMTMQR